MSDEGERRTLRSLSIDFIIVQYEYLVRAAPQDVASINVVACSFAVSVVEISN
jgi:hypothetical protein